MGLPEPNGPLWSAVKAIDDPWPPDDEVVARDLGAALGRGADAMSQGARQTGRAGADAVASWRDAAGEKFGGKVDEFAQAAARVDQSMRGVAAHAERYAGELESAKTAITSTIAANEKTHAQLANPMLGPVGPTLQNAYATKVATDLRAMIDAKAAGLGGGGPAPAQPPAEPPDPRNPVAAFVGDTLRALGDGDVQRARAIGETVDDGIDALGSGAGNVLRALGATDAGDAVERGADGLGDTAAENWLQNGATSRNFGYDLAQGIDGTDQPRTVYISHERYPEAAAHIDDAQGGTIWKGFESAPGEPKDSVLTVDRDGAADRRDAAIGVVPPEPGYDRDEYPPAVSEEGGEGSSVRYIDPGDNRGAGASQGNQLNGRTGSIERQLDGTGLQVIGDGRADDGDKFRVETF